MFGVMLLLLILDMSMLQWLRKINNRTVDKSELRATSVESSGILRSKEFSVSETLSLQIKEIEEEENPNQKNKIIQKHVKQLSNLKKWGAILEICDWFLKEHSPYPKQYSHMGKSELMVGSPAKAAEYLSKAIETDFTLNNLLMLFQAQKIINDWDEAHKTISTVIDNFRQSEDTPIETQYNRLRGSAEYLRQSSEICLRTPQPNHPKGVVVFTSYLCEGTIGLNLLAAQKLKRDGYAVIHICEGMMPEQKTGLTEIDSLHGIVHYQKNKLRENAEKTGLTHEWTIDWQNKIVEAVGINFYQCFFERLARDLHKYSIEMDDKVEPYFQSLLVLADVAFTVALKIEKQICLGLSLPVRCVSASSQYVPYGIFRIFCMERGKNSGMEFISSLIGKEYNFFNRINDHSHFVSTRNVTAYPEVRMPQLPPAQTLDKWVASNSITDEELGFVRTFINHDRNLTGRVSDEGLELLSRIKEEKEKGRKIVCIFGKVIWDFDYPHDSGPAHTSLSDWIQHTVHSAQYSDALFLIKPHPHEEMRNISGVPNERFVDLLPSELPANVILMGGDWVNTKDLIPFLDLGVVWAGTVELDLGINGVPVLACCDWGRYDYPVGFMAPKDRREYEILLQFPNRVEKPENCEQRCTDILRYMASEEILVPYIYYRRSTTNAFIIPTWYMDQVDEFFKNGDPHIDRLAGRFFDDRPELNT